MITKNVTKKWLDELKTSMNMKPTELTHQIVMAIIDPLWTGTMSDEEEKISKDFNKELHKLLKDSSNLYKVRTVLKRDVGKNRIAAEDDFIARVLDNFITTTPNEDWIE